MQGFFYILSLLQQIDYLFCNLVEMLVKNNVYVIEKYGVSLYSSYVKYAIVFDNNSWPFSCHQFYRARIYFAGISMTTGKYIINTLK